MDVVHHGHTALRRFRSTDPHRGTRPRSPQSYRRHQAPPQRVLHPVLAPSGRDPEGRSTIWLHPSIPLQFTATRALAPAVYTGSMPCSRKPLLATSWISSWRSRAKGAGASTLLKRSPDIDSFTTHRCLLLPKKSTSGTIMTGRRRPIAVHHSPPRTVIFEPCHQPACLPGMNSHQRSNLAVRDHLPRGNCVDDSPNLFQKTQGCLQVRGLRSASSTLANGPTTKIRRRCACRTTMWSAVDHGRNVSRGYRPHCD